VAELISEVIVFSALEKSLYYSTPPELQDKVRVGSRVLIPLGRKEAMGLIYALHDGPVAVPAGVNIRPLTAVVDSSPVITEELVALCRWISSYYFYPPGEVVQAALPAGIEITPLTFLRLTSVGREEVKSGYSSELVKLLVREERALLQELKGKPDFRKQLRKELELLEKKGWIERVFECRPPAVRSRTVKSVRLAMPPDPAASAKNESLRSLIRALEQGGEWIPVRELRRSIKNCDYWVRKLEADGVLQAAEIEELRESQCAQSIPPVVPPSLTADQNAVMEAVLPHIERPSFQAFLVYGVTGSGKTEIYLRLVEETVKQGKGALVLVPEIALSTQLEALFRQRFGARLAVWHSGLSPGVRYDQWREILAGKRSVILGVRSSIFMPVSNLGIIIVDEEHDASYKQEDRLRYHARDVALMRASKLGIPIVLGSATPSLQSLNHCRTKRYHLLSIPGRVLDRPLPTFQVVDMRRERGGSRIISNALRKELLETVQNGEQALLFLNRRGFATFYLCPECGNVVQCLHCSVSLTYHQKDDCLRCHYCGSERPVPDRCPDCDHGALTAVGFGTERIEEEVKKILPGAGIVRIDRDTASQPRNMLKLLDAVRCRRADVLIGTQMIAKGHDFPHITLVGVVNADTALQISDFRAGESTVQLLMQVAGRAGRGEKPGRVILQTYNPQHYTIRSVVNMDYMEFCKEELASREKLQYPPYTRMLKLLVTAPNEGVTRDAAHLLASLSREASDLLSEHNRHVAVLGPAPAPVQKLNNRFRWHIYIKGWTSQDLQLFIEAVMDRMKTVPQLRRVQIAVDRDPVSSF
jgi:primosomal protein N' (replication factor Y)